MSSIDSVNPGSEDALQTLSANSETVRTEAQVNLKSLTSLPIDSQLLIAYCLRKGSGDFTLLTNDGMARELLASDWLDSMPCSSIGIRCFQIKPRVWEDLVACRSGFLTVELLSLMAGFKRRKSAQYPWNW